MAEPRRLSAVAASWDAEYVAGRYAGAAPDGFVADIIAAAAAHDRADRFIVGDLSALPHAVQYDLVIGIQVFQHGRRARAARHLADATARVRPGGLLCVRVNAAGTDVEYDHDRFEQDDHGGYSVRYRAGPKTGLDIHFFSAAGLSSLIPGSFTEVLPLRRHTTTRHPPSRGQWSQWEVIWRRPGDGGDWEHDFDLIYHRAG